MISGSQKSAITVSKSLVSGSDITSLLTMSENFQNVYLAPTTRAQQLSVPVVSNAPSLTGSVCTFSRASAPAVSSAWLLPPGSGASLQPLPGSAYLYQHPGTNMLAGFPGQSHFSMSDASSSGALQWQVSGSTGGRTSSLGHAMVTTLDQGTSDTSMSMAAQYGETSHAYTIVPVYPTVHGRLVQQTSCQIQHHTHGLSLPYQGGSQVYYYDPNTPGPWLCGEVGPCLQSCISGTHGGGGACAPQPQNVMVLREITPTSVPSTVPISTVHYSAPVQCIPETSCQAMADSQDMDANLRLETSQGLQSQRQTFCLPQTAELVKSSTLESKPSSECWEVSGSPFQSPSRFLALPPAPCAKQAENENLDDIQTELSQPLDAYPISKHKQQDSLLLPSKMPNTCDFSSPTEPVSQGNTPGSLHADLGENSPSLEDHWALDQVLASSNVLADMSILVEDVWLPQLFSPLTDSCDIPAPTDTKIPGTGDGNEVQEKTTVIKGLPGLDQKEEEEVSDLTDEAPDAEIQPQDEGLVEEEVVAGRASASDRSPDITAKHPHHRAQKASSSRPRKAKEPAHEKTKRPRGNKSKKSEEPKQSGGKAKAEGKPAIPRAKRRKGHPPELCQGFFKKPRSSLGLHMLESVQVFHALGKKTEQKTGLSSCRALGNTRCTKELKPSPALKSGLHVLCQEAGTEKTQGKGQKPEGSAGTECPSPSQCELPPPGKVKLVPLPFLSLDKPQARRVPRRPHSVASQRAPAPDPARPPSNSAQPPAVNPSQPAPASTTFLGATKPAGPVSSSLPRPGFNHPAQPRVSQSAACRPAPYKTSCCTSLHKEPVSTAPTKAHSPPKANSQYLLEDFSRQPIPWRKVDFPGPVESTPITDEQRPEREAMKRQAQRERENAAQYTALGRVQYFVQREKDMEISDYYGYMI